MARHARGTPPTYRLHKPTGLAVVTVKGKDRYCGPFGSPESFARYGALLAESTGAAVAADVADSPSGPSVAGVLVAYLKFARGYYVKGGKPTGTLDEIETAIKPLQSLYGATPATNFGPLKLEAIRNAYVGNGWQRATVNKRISMLKRIFKWAASRELLPAATYAALAALDGLRRGRTPAGESAGVKPVADAFVDATLPHVSKQVRAMIELQRLTGARPAEICMVRTRDLDTTGKVWVYRPESHKTEHHGKTREVRIGPAAQKILKPWLRTVLDEYLFQPKEAIVAHRLELRSSRKSPIQPSQQSRRIQRKPRREPGDHYTRDSYRRAIARGIEAANAAAVASGDKREPIPTWAPNRLRHNFATMVRKSHGLEAARILLGHSSAVTSEIYAEVDSEKAAAIIGKLG